MWRTSGQIPRSKNRENNLQETKKIFQPWACSRSIAGSIKLTHLSSSRRCGPAAVRIVVVFAGLCVIENLCQA